MRKLLLPVFLLLSFLGSAQEDAALKYGNLITAKGLREKLSIIASADMEGRATATEGQRKAAAYIEAQFKQMGLKPGNNGSYQQYYPVYKHDVTTCKLSVNGKPLQDKKEFNYQVQAANYITKSSSTGSHIATSEVVYAGYGMLDTFYRLNDYAGLDVKGKLVVVIAGADNSYPDSLGKRDGTSRSSWYFKANLIQSMGAAGVIFIRNSFPLNNPIQESWMNIYPSTSSNGFVVSNVSEAVGSALLGRANTLRIPALAELRKGIYHAEVKMDLVITDEALQSSNVIGVLEGSDKKDEYVFLTAHYDHIGKEGDVIYYGADDDGSGTVSVLQMAEAFAAAAKNNRRPSRTIVFMTVSGEELGLFGSEYYSEHPLFPLAKTSADLNTDMIGRIDTERKTADSLNYIYVIGHDKLSSDLVKINEAANNKYTRLVLDYKYDDPKDPEQIYYRSDHYNFAKKGVPILFFYDGMLLADYHQPTDTVDKIYFSLMEKRVKMVFHTAWEIANRAEMLKRDIPLN